MRMPCKHICFLIIATLLLDSEASGQIAVVVHADNSTSSMSIHELKLIYLGKKTSFTNGTDIELTEFRSLGDKFYKLALGMTKREVRKYWLKKVFSGYHAVPPADYDDIGELQARICKNKSTISFVDLVDVTGCMKVLPIDGFKPEDEDYPLKSKPEGDSP